MKNKKDIIFNKIRFAIMYMLYKEGEVSYKKLKKFLGITDGNLASHLRKLEEAGFINFEKTFEGRKPKTIYFLTPKGKKEFEKFIVELEKVIKNVQKGGEAGYE